jgi:hypothetical protein
MEDVVVDPIVEVVGNMEDVVVDPIVEVVCHMEDIVVDPIVEVSLLDCKERRGLFI